MIFKNFKKNMKQYINSLYNYNKSWKNIILVIFKQILTLKKA